MALMEGVSMITAVIMGTLNFMTRGGQTFSKSGLLDTFLAVALCFHSLKSISCSLAIILVHKPYRSVDYCKIGLDFPLRHNFVHNWPTVTLIRIQLKILQARCEENILEGRNGSHNYLERFQ